MRVGILGAGFMGSTHGRAFTNVPGVEIAGIYGLSEGRAKPLADELAIGGRLADDVLRERSLGSLLLRKHLADAAAEQGAEFDGRCKRLGDASELNLDSSAASTSPNGAIPLPRAG